MADKTGSTKDKTPIILLEWNFRFWDVRKASDSFGDQTLRGGGYGKQGDAAISEVSLAGDPDIVKVPFRKATGIGLLTFDHKGETVDLVLKAPPDHDSGRPAGPDSDSPKSSAAWNNWVQIQLHDLTFPKLELDENGFFKVTGGKFLEDGKAVEVDGAEFKIKGAKYDLVACQVSKDDTQAGLAHHGYARIHPPEFSKKEKQDVQIIEVDWLFDVFRPYARRKFLYKKSHYLSKLFPKKKRKELSESQLKQLKAAEKADKDDKKEEWHDGRLYNRGVHKDPYLVIHVTGESDITSQLQQLTSWAAIHYIVCWNGHVIKVVEDEKGCYHAGWQTPKAGWRDHVFGAGRSHVANKTAIGIEHLAKAGANWPIEQENASVHLVRRICAAHSIPPCSVVRHRDLALDELTAGAKNWQHVEGKVCPGSAVPWARYQHEQLALWPLGLNPGEIELEAPEGDAFYHGIFDVPGITFIDDDLKGAEKTPDNEDRQKQAIRELKGHLTLIGYWVITHSGGNAETYDRPAKDSVLMCQEKFMSMRGAPPAKPGRVDRETAKILWAVCQHGDKVLPPLVRR